MSRSATSNGPTVSPRVGAAQSRPRGKRRWKKLVITVLILVGLLVGADFAAAAFAEHTISQQAREKLGLAADPGVVIRGFPFATQALNGNYDHLSISATGVPVADKLRDVELNAELRNVAAPLSDLTSGQTNSIVIGELTGQIRVKAADMARISPLNKVENFHIQPANEEYVRAGQGNPAETPSGSEGGAGEAAQDTTAGIRLSGNVQFAGQNLEIICYALIQLEGTVIRITPERMSFGNDGRQTNVPNNIQKALLPNFKAEINTGTFPFAVTPTSVKVHDDSISIAGEAKNVTFAGISTGR